MICVLLQGGLGNQLFQLAFSEYLATLNRKQTCLELSEKHTSYFDTLFIRWGSLYRKNVYVNKTIHEPHNSWVIPSILNTRVVGFFQSIHYILPNFISKLDFSCSHQMLTKYPQTPECIFLHIRGGDYLNTDYDIDLTSYYTRAISLFPKDSTFMIFTNDFAYAKSKEFLRTTRHTFVDESEVDSLYLMSKCKGGICANSTFSWWGAYLQPNRQLTIPSRWTRTTDSTRFNFGCTVL